MTKLYLQLSREEIQNQIPYALICETRYGSVWNTGKRKRLWDSSFTEQEKEQAAHLFHQANKWYLKTGAPDKVKMTPETLNLWQRLAVFCMSI